MVCKTINEIADEVIRGIKDNKDPFITPVVVCHNTKVAQWFKAYYLKNYPEVLMNVKFETLGVFINDIVNPSGEHHIMSRTDMRDYIIKVLLSTSHYDSANPSNPTNYIFDDTGHIKGINLYEFAQQLSTLFMNYEYDLEVVSGWEQDLYNEVIKCSKSDDCYTTKSLFEEIKGTSVVDSVRASINYSIYIINNSYITNLYSEILDLYNLPDVRIFEIDRTTNQAILCEERFAAPSRLREIEALHSKICKIVQSNKGCRFNDFLVYAPEISDYVSSIHTVFKQDDKDYPAIPYRIVGEHKEQKDMINALHVLRDIANKRFFTRNDLKKFVSNPMIKYVRDIDDSEISTWMELIDATNTYRNGKAEDDWDYFIKRVLIAKLVADDSSIENKTDLSGKAYLPYHSISVDFESENKLIDIINALSNWSNAFNDELNNICLDRNKLDEMTTLLDALFSQKGSDGEEANYLYQKVYEQNEIVKNLNINIPANTWVMLMLDAPNRYVSHPADMFVGGVTFMSINVDDIVAEPYIFAIGFSSENFPRVDHKSELDQSTRHISSDKLDETSIINLCKNSSHFICSYVSRDLVKDCDFFPSSLMPNLPSGKNTEIISLDENRNYKELFTKREFFNKDYINNLLAGVAVKTPVAPSGDDNIETTIRLTDIKNYLENTFIYKLEKLLKRSDEDVLSNEYEMIDSTPLLDTNMVKSLIISESNGVDEYEATILSRKLPEKAIGDLYYHKYKEQVESTVKLIIDNGYAVKPLPPLALETTTNIKWTLNCNTDVFYREDGNKLFYLSTGIRYDKEKYFYSIYVFSLMDIALRRENEEYLVKLCIGNEVISRQYSCTPSKAIETLNCLYMKMIDFADVRYMDDELFEIVRDEETDPPKSLIEFNKFLVNSAGSKWKYSKDAQMVNTSEAFGYDDNKISDQITNFFDEIKSLILYMGV